MKSRVFKDELAFNFGRDLVTPYLDSKNAYTLLSEKELKFDLFYSENFVKPDLVILPKEDLNEPVEIWDFKTGGLMSQKEKSTFSSFSCMR